MNKNKFFKQFLISLCVIILIIIGYLVYDSHKNPFIYTGPKQDQYYLHGAVVSGRSMEPTLYNGQNVQIFNYQPKVNDIISFKLVKDGKSYIKRLTKIDDKNCYWIEGDHNDSWVNNGISVHSYDSTDYGWLCPVDRKLDGVVKLKQSSLINTKQG